MYEKELQRILTASQNNALTFFVGAGVSALSGAPTWKRLIHAISDRLGQARKDEYSSDEYLQIPQMFYYSLGENKEEYYTFVKAQLHSSPMLPNVIHREMLNLNPVSFITTNYDTLFHPMKKLSGGALSSQKAYSINYSSRRKSLTKVSS